MNEMSAVIRQISMERANERASERDRNGFYLRMTPAFVAEEEKATLACHDPSIPPLAQ